MADGAGVEAAVAPALGVSMNVQVDGNRQIVFQTHVGRDDPLPILNAALDKMTRAADRQVAKYMLVSLRKELHQHEKGLRDMTEDLARVEAENRARWDESGRKGPYKLDAKEQAAKVNIGVSAKKYQSEIVDIKARIVETEAKVADVGA